MFGQGPEPLRHPRLATEARFGLRGTLSGAATPTGPLAGTIDFTFASPDQTLPDIDEALSYAAWRAEGQEVLARLRLRPTRPVARSFALGLTHGYRPSTPR